MKKYTIMLITLLFAGSSLQISGMISRMSQSEYEEPEREKISAEKIIEQQKMITESAYQMVNDAIRSEKKEIVYEKDLPEEIYDKMDEGYVLTDEDYGFNDADYNKIIKVLQGNIDQWRYEIRASLKASKSKIRSYSSINPNVKILMEAARYGDKKIEELEKKKDELKKKPSRRGKKRIIKMD